MRVKKRMTEISFKLSVFDAELESGGFNGTFFNMMSLG